MDQRVAFMADWLRDEWTMTELAERYQISRKTAYKWVDRYRRTRRRGWRSDRGRRTSTAGRWPTDLRAAVLALRRRASALGAQETPGHADASGSRAPLAGARARWGICCGARA